MICPCKFKRNSHTGSKDITCTSLWPWKLDKGYQKLNHISMQVWWTSRHCFKKYVVEGKFIFHNLAFNFDKMLKVNKSSWNRWKSSKRFKRSINFSEISHNYIPSVTLKMRSMSPKFNQLLLMVHLCKKIHLLVQDVSYIQDYDLENGVKVTKILICLKPVTVIYPLKSDEYSSICSRNISILAIKSTFLGWLLTLKMRGHCHQNTISS